MIFKMYAKEERGGGGEGRGMSEFKTKKLKSLRFKGMLKLKVKVNN